MMVPREIPVPLPDRSPSCPRPGGRRTGSRDARRDPAASGGFARLRPQAGARSRPARLAPAGTARDLPAQPEPSRAGRSSRQRPASGGKPPAPTVLLCLCHGGGASGALPSGEPGLLPRHDRALSGRVRASRSVSRGPSTAPPLLRDAVDRSTGRNARGQRPRAHGAGLSPPARAFRWNGRGRPDLRAGQTADRLATIGDVSPSYRPP